MRKTKTKTKHESKNPTLSIHYMGPFLTLLLILINYCMRNYNQSLIDFKGKFNNFTIPLTKIANIR